MVCGASGWWDQLPTPAQFRSWFNKCCCDSQLVNVSWPAGMKDGYWLGKDHPGVYLGERQALNEDYTHSGFDRGHLNPNGHHPGTRERKDFSQTRTSAAAGPSPSSEGASLIFTPGPWWNPLACHSKGSHLDLQGSVRTLGQDLSIGFISDVFRI